MSIKVTTLSIWISFISFICSIASLCVFYFRADPIKIEWLSLLIGFGTFVITTYVSVQIYHSFTLKKDIEKTLYEERLKIKKEVDKLIHDRIADYDHTVSAGIYQITGLDRYGKGMHLEALHYFMEALDEINKATDQTPKEGIISCIHPYITTTIPSFAIKDKQKQKYLRILSNCEHEKSHELIEGFVRRF